MKQLAYIFILFSILLTSCQEVIDIDLKDAEPVLVIEANLNDDPTSPTLVQLTKTIDYFNPDTPEFVTGALVIIRDDMGKIDTLPELFKGFYVSTTLKGTPGHTYTLEVQHEGKTYNATSYMSPSVMIDSIWTIKPELPAGPSGPISDSTRIVACSFTDPASTKNYYRLIAEEPNGNSNFLFSSGEYFLIDDRLNNGAKVDFPFRGDLFSLGDTVNVELRAIDEPIYKYFTTLASLAGFGAATSSAPGNPPTNITGGALGYFSAYSVQKGSIIIKE